VFVVEEEKIRSALENQQNTPTPSLCCFLRNQSQKPGAFAVEMATLSQVGRKAWYSAFLPSWQASAAEMQKMYGEKKNEFRSY
jgi:hypothetical protein